VGGIYIQDGASNNGNSLFIADNNGAVRFVVNQDGYVGIGASPATGKVLTISNAGADAAVRINAPTGYYSYLELTENSSLTSGDYWQIGKIPTTNALQFWNGSERARISSAGNLTVGSTGNLGRIGSAVSDATTTFSSLGYGMLGLQNTSNTANNYTWMTFNESNSNYVAAIGSQNVAHNPASGAVYGDLVFATKTNGVGGFPTIKMRLSSIGQLQMPTSAPFTVEALRGSGFGYAPTSYGALVVGSVSNNTTVCINVDPIANTSGSFSGTGAEVMFRNSTQFITPNSANTTFLSVLGLIDGDVVANRNLFIGTTTNISYGGQFSSGLTINKGTIRIGVQDNGDGGIFSTFSLGSTIGISAGHTYGSGAGFAWTKYSPSSSGGPLVVTMAGSGGVQLTNGATSWSSYSDIRLKDVTGSIVNALAGVMQLEPIRFTWKHDPDKKPNVGIAAHTVQQVVPEAVDAVAQTADNITDKTEYLAVRYQEIIPLLTAALQELKNEFDAYKASHP
jgi:hypothetical protein